MPTYVLPGQVHQVQVSETGKRLVYRRFYVPTKEDLLFLRTVYPGQNPETPSWFTIKGDLIAAGCTVNNYAEAPVLLSLLRKIQAAPTSQTTIQPIPPPPTPPQEKLEARIPDSDLSPSRIKARAAYEWAISQIPGAENMTVAQLYEAIQNHPSRASEALPPNAESFAKYLRDAGVRRYDKSGHRRQSGSVRRREQM